MKIHEDSYCLRIKLQYENLNSVATLVSVSVSCIDICKGGVSLEGVQQGPFCIIDLFLSLLLFGFMLFFNIPIQSSGGK